MFRRAVGLITLVSFLIVTTGCGKNKQICMEPKPGEKTVCKTYSQYGLFNADDMRNPQVQYRVVVGNIIWAILFVETVVAPIVLLGWFMHEPVSPKTNAEPGVL